MKTRTQTDIWIFRIVFVLGVLAVISAIGAIALPVMGWSTPQILLAFGVVALAGLARLWVSPLNQVLCD